MRVLLQDTDTGLFFADSDRWTDNPDEGHDFRSGNCAIDAALKHRLANAAMYYLFPDSSQNFSVPIPKGIK